MRIAWPGVAVVALCAVSVSPCRAQEPSFDGLVGLELVEVRTEGEDGGLASATLLSRLDAAALDRANPKLHSWCVMDVATGETRGSARSATRPRSVASTIKLAVVNATLREVAAGRVGLEETLTVVAENVQTSDGEKVGQRYTVRNAIYQTLVRSSNTCPNLLARRLGGLAKLNAILAAMGYTKTRYNYLSSLRRTETEPSPGSTAQDMARVARDFYRTFRAVQGIGQGSAWYAFGHPHDLIKAEGHVTLGGKIGSNSLCATNTGLFEVGGRVYAIVVFSEENGLANGYYADRYLTRGSTTIADAIAAAGGSKA